MSGVDEVLASIDEELTRGDIGAAIRLLRGIADELPRNRLAAVLVVGGDGGGGGERIRRPGPGGTGRRRTP